MEKIITISRFSHQLIRSVFALFVIQNLKAKSDNRNNRNNRKATITAIANINMKYLKSLI